jgi:hypothetical protein
VTYGKIIFNFFAANNPFVYGLLACAFIWWRGIRLSRSRLYFDDIYTNFGIQLLLLVVLTIFWGFTYKTEQLKTLTSQVGIYVAGFFFFGLLGLAVSNLKIIQERIRKKGETTKNFSRKWLSIILTVIGSMFLVAVIFASLFSEQTQTTIRQIMNTITDIYAWVVEIIIYLVGWIVQLVYFVVQWIVSLFSGQKPPPTPDLQGLPDMNNVKDRTPGSLSPTIFLVIKLFILALIILAVVLVIMKAVKRRGLANQDEDLDEEKESLWSWDGFKADFILFFKNLLQRFRRKNIQPVPQDLAIYWKPEEDVRRRLSIREIYQHLLWHGARLHVPREGFETPSEYAARLGHFTPDIQQPLDEITGLYLDVRYGDYPAADAQTENANTIWQKLLDALNPLERQE